MPHKHGRPHHSVPSPTSFFEPSLGPVSGAVTVDITSTHALNHFLPQSAFGAGVDSVSTGSEPQIFSSHNLGWMLSTGQGSVSYRLYTELNVEDWHWNPVGSWSDAANHQGYFVGSTSTKNVITESHGYSLVHRGSTFDNGDNVAYSCLTDGNASTYWKSNPYLSSAYTKESDSLHPQWALIDLGSTMLVDAVKLQWANPYAISYRIQYWTGDDALYDQTNGNWVDFPSGVVTAGKGGTVNLKISALPIPVEFVRILMTQSSNTYDSHGSSDPRNRMGYALYEIGVGVTNLTGGFTDYVKHEADQGQTYVYVSSNDPWHTAASEDSGAEQLGLDYIFEGRLAKRIPAMVPVPLVYSTPENAVAEMTYLTQRKYSFVGVELGEEADGQWITPEDYAALYLQWATALHKALPQLKLGGPVTSYNGAVSWPTASGETDYLKRFYGYLLAHNAGSLLSFVSTEHYPFYQAPLDWTLVQQEVGQVQSIFDWISKAGIPKATPVYVTEYNLSAAPDQANVDLEGALWHAVFVGEFMNRGGAASYFYQYFPYDVSSGGTSFGLIGMFTSDGNDQAVAQTSQYFSARLISQEWCQPVNALHTLYPSTTNIKNLAGQELVLSYAVSRPDGQYAVMLVNTDSAAHSVTVSLKDTKTHTFSGTLTQSQFSSKNYIWISNASNSTAKPDGPYLESTIAVTGSTIYTLPAHSITVLKAKIL